MWAPDLEEAVKKLRIQQIAILENQNDNSRVKSLRRFSSKEVAGVLGITESYLRNRVSSGEGFPEGELVGKSRSFSLEEIHKARNWLYKSTGNVRYLPRRRGSEKMCSLAMTNFKGGVGKSTTSTHVAQYLALRGYRVLLVDLDAQASTTALFGIDPARLVGRDKDGNVLPAGTSIEGWINRENGKDEEAAHAAIRHTYWPNIDLVAGSALLHRAEDGLKNRQMSTFSAPVSAVEVHAEVRAFLDYVSEDYDVAIMDCRPDINMLSVNAFTAANGLVMPVLATNMDLQSLTEFLAFLAMTEKRLSRMEGSSGWQTWSFLKVLVNRFVANNRPQIEIVDTLNLVLKEKMIRTQMLETTALGSAGNLKWTLYEYMPAKSEERSYRRAIAALDEVGSIIEGEILGFWGRKASPDAANLVAAE